MKSKIIGITGSIATGKSTATEYIRELGYVVIDADKVSHFLMKKGNVNYHAILKEFGNEVLNEDLEIDRKKLGQIVFNDDNKLKLLNNITHKNIFEEIKDNIKKYNDSAIFIDIPLLIELKNENKLDISFDEIWLVYVDQKKQINRLSKRNNISLEEAKKLVEKQLSIEDKIKYSDFVIDNSRDIDYLKYQIKEKMRYV